MQNIQICIVLLFTSWSATSNNATIEMMTSDVNNNNNMAVLARTLLSNF